MNYVIVPLSDSHWSANVAANLERQTSPIRAVIVENNGGEYSGGYQPWRVIQSAPGKCDAINAAMELVEPDALVVCFDQDDWYGSESVQRKCAALEHCDITGMPRRWVRLPDGQLWHFDNHDLDTPAHLWGGSLAWRASAFEAFPEYFLGVEIDWVVARVAAGCTFDVGDYPDVYVRHNRQHAWRSPGVSHERLMRSGTMGERTELGLVDPPFQ